MLAAPLLALAGRGTPAREKVATGGRVSEATSVTFSPALSTSSRKPLLPRTLKAAESGPEEEGRSAAEVSIAAAPKATRNTVKAPMAANRSALQPNFELGLGIG